MKFVAEIGMNHNGNFDLCYELIKQAKYSGADIAKFQLGWRDGKGEINQIDDKVIKNLLSWGNYFDIEIMFSIISDKAFKMIQKYKMAKYKIASRTLIDNFKLAEKIIKENKTTYVSLGMWKKKKLPFNNKNIKYLWCKSLYPTYDKDLKNFPKNFSVNKYYGYSDHTIGIETCLLAVSRGAEMIEKHFTLDKSSNVIRDHALSATPDEFRNLVNLGREINKKIKMKI
jgi:N,N'-diacetyllegionaminate synthase